MRRYFFILIICLLVGFVGLGIKLLNTDKFAVQTVVVNGDLRFIQKDAVKGVLQPLIKKSFFTVNLTKIQVAVQRLPWVSDVAVRRVWPNRIVINITACKPVARWNNKAFLNAYGEIFMPQNHIELAQNLPEFFGAQNQTVKMLDNYQQMENILAPLSLKIISLRYETDWQLRLDNNVALQLGHQDILKRLERFALAYKKILGSHGNMIPKSVDLRYSNGLAVSY